MYKIKEVEITGFWGRHTVKSKMNDSVNIFIGQNGSGKTTFISILQSIFEVDIERLYNLQFEKVTLKLNKGTSNIKIQVTKVAEDLEYKEILFQIGTSKYPLPYISSTVDYRRSGRIHPRLKRMIDELKEKISQMIDLSYLSVHRGAIDSDERDRPNRKMNLVDLRLAKLNQKFASYQWQLESRINMLSRQFQKDVLKLMLFDEKHDHINLSKRQEFDSEKAKLGLRQAFRDLKVYDTDIKNKIDKHISRVSKAVTAVNEYNDKESSGLAINDITPLSLVSKSNKIVQLSKAMEEEKDKILEPINQYLNLLSSFIEGKTFDFSKEHRGGLNVFKNDESFPLEQLSSGEKQLIILFTEALLQHKKPCIFIADEPELSLHISWQRKIIPSVDSINPNAQLIVATHSPEVVGKYKNSLINMKDIING